MKNTEKSFHKLLLYVETWKTILKCIERKFITWGESIP